VSNGVVWVLSDVPIDVDDESEEALPLVCSGVFRTVSAALKSLREEIGYDVGKADYRNDDPPYYWWYVEPDAFGEPICYRAWDPERERTRWLIEREVIRDT
jgi:hypothetical protein